MSIKERFSRFRNRGQATVLGLVLVLVSATTVVLLYNTGQTASEKTRLVNAADAAAYSGAVFVARNLNFMAYTNRAMIANHVAVGHFVSYMSWLRYVKDVARSLRNYTGWVPYWGPAIRVIDKIGGKMINVTEKVGDFYVPASNGLNEIIYGAQYIADTTLIGTLAVGALTQAGIMNKVAKEYSPTIRVNDKSDITKSNGLVSLGQITSDMSKIFKLTKGYNASNDKGRIKKMVEASYGNERRFIAGNRGWGLDFFVIKFNKDGNTTHQMNGNLTDWKAKDTMTYRWWTIKGWKSKNLGKGSATAREFDDDYEGITGYYDMKKPGDKKDHALTMTAYATMPMSEASIFSLLGLKTTTQRIAASSRAEIRHRRPDPPSFSTIGKGEYSNIYNPFWEVRLIDSGIGL